MIIKNIFFIVLLSCISVFGQIYQMPNTDVTNGLIAHYKLDEMSYDGTAGEVKDSSGNGNNGTSYGGVLTNPGKIGRAGYFDSVSHINAMLPSVLEMPVSLSLWVNFEENKLITSVSTVISFESYRPRISFTTYRGYLSYEIYHSSLGGDIIFKVGSIGDNKWHLMTLVLSSTNSICYVDGTKNMPLIDAVCPSFLNGWIRLSSVTDDNSQKFNGLIDDVRIYDRALSPEEVIKLYNLGFPKKQIVVYSPKTIPYECLPTNGLIAHWKLDETSYNGTQGEVKDSSGNGNNGTSLGHVITNPGKIERCGIFDGLDTGVYVPALDNYLDTKSAATFSCWIKTSKVQHRKLILGWWCSYDNCIRLESGYLRFFLKTDTTPYSTIQIEESQINDGKWHFLCGTYDGAKQVLFVDDDFQSVDLTGIIVSPDIFGFGTIGTLSEYSFDGSIDDVRVYNRALSHKEVQELYNARPIKDSAVAVYSGNTLVSNPLKKDYPNTVSENIEPVTLTFKYVSTYPAAITIGRGSYGQPADPSKALVDDGDGVFVPWTSNTITLKGKQIRFRGDWRNTAGNFMELFSSTFIGGHYVTMSGGFDFEGAPAAYMFQSTFYGCSNLTGPIPSGLFGAISGTPAANMFNSTFTGCSRLTGPIPSGLFGNISGAPAANMFYVTFYECSNLTGPIPSGLFGNISGAPAANMFNSTFTGCSRLTGPIPSGLFGNMSGTPAADMFNSTFTDCSRLTGPIPSGLFGNISGAPAANMFNSTFYRCPNLTGESALMPDGTTHLYEQFPTASGTDCQRCYYNATGLNDYATMPSAWK